LVEKKQYIMNTEGYKLIKETLPELFRILDDSPLNRELKSELKEYVKDGMEKPFYRSVFYAFSKDDQKVIDGLLELIDELVKDKMLSKESIDFIQERLVEIKNQ